MLSERLPRSFKEKEFRPLNVQFDEVDFRKCVPFNEEVQRRRFNGKRRRHASGIVVDDGPDPLIVGVEPRNAHGELARCIRKRDRMGMDAVVKMIPLNVRYQPLIGRGKGFKCVYRSCRSHQTRKMEGHFPEVCPDIQHGHSGPDAMGEKQMQVMVVVAMN
jgi:hypothetical protein